ncbi:uncharacterized protein [Symphalangus syndactylus]|uniref:uncharacterized protein n=1 Tax=Symphalangus syndactylus TaxID=9590 RepID=UPI0030042368
MPRGPRSLPNVNKARVCAAEAFLCVDLGLRQAGVVLSRILSKEAAVLRGKLRLCLTSSDRDGRGRGGSRARAARPRSKLPARALGPQRCRPPDPALCKPCRGPPGRVTRSYLGQPFPAATVWPARGQRRPGTWRTARGGGSSGARLAAARSLETGFMRGPGQSGSSVPERFIGAPYNPGRCLVLGAEMHCATALLAEAPEGPESAERASGRRQLELRPEGSQAGLLPTYLRRPGSPGVGQVLSCPAPPWPIHHLIESTACWGPRAAPAEDARRLGHIRPQEGGQGRLPEAEA